MNSFIEEKGGKLTFPPRFGEHNQELYGQKLGYDTDAMEDLKKRGII
jgi:hypothetical protein